MALIKSSLLADSRGSIGGTTYSRNRGGSYARNRTVPINPQSLAQERARSDLAQYSVGWGSLTAEQRNAWNQYAETVIGLNVLGESITFTGQQMYIRSNTLLELAGLSAITVPPDSGVGLQLSVGNAPALEISDGDDELTMTLNANFTGTVLAFTSPTLNPGVSSVKQPYRFYGTVALTASTAVVIPEGVNARTYLLGGRFAARFVGVNSVGRVSNELFLIGSVVA